MPKPTFLKLPDDKRERITEHAIAEFAANSYRQASLSRIVARSGIAKGSMYQYFHNKLDLYEWLVTVELERRRGAWLTTHAGSYPEGAGLFATLERMVMVRVGFMLAHPRLAQLAASALEPTSDEDLRALNGALRRAHIDALVAVIREAQLAGEIRNNVDARVLAHLVDSLIAHGTSNALLDRLGVEVHELDTEHRRVGDGEWRTLVDQALDLIHGGIRAVVADRRPASASAAASEADPRPRAHIN